MQTKKTIIIGSGPAGLTAAIYLARARLNPIVLGGIAYGGQLMLTTDVENYPGFSSAVQGPTLMETMIEQAKYAGAQVLYKEVTNVDFSKTPLVVYTDEQTYEADGIVIATGASAKTLGIANEKELSGRGISYCATCDGPLFKEKIVAVVGGGDSAMEDALFLSRFTKKVHLIHRRETFRASKIMQEKVAENGMIEVHYASTIQEVHGEEKLEEIYIQDEKTRETKLLQLDGLFVAIGHIPNTQIFRGVLDMDDMGYLKTTKGRYTNISGVVSAGDVDDTRYKQAVTAAGEGCRAALDLQHYLEGIFQ